ncbi:MAG: hypothetical protein CMH90_08760 [Oceanicaulis sp.]|uniref:TetR/AcrR family transcriptional regulator n=1 Tax=Oceanicaulis sp. UBA2681 TaxID=1947007 RepID=UPI000C0A4B8E|nr:TetR/AcrR family transcriptional regulator [Oceanicaulis sp. UBA2681]MAP49554.1 hypothetical protein [Oceanicaulis sp.]HCR66309.1 hypothetical protein [Oceanicaulis sp.]|tara:strand:- start:3975 stop:4616 length:642 start_codon:yes stop_codon:yes gene_type:complete
MKGAKPALQTRSQQTRDRLVAALERLLRDKAFENISVAEIAREAGVSVGAVYTRFENKDAFIPVLFELYKARLDDHKSEQHAEAQSDDDESLRGVLRRTLRVGAQFMAREAHLMRAAHLYAHTRPDLIGDGWEAISEAGRQSVGALYDHFASEITQSDRTIAVETLTYFLNTALIEAGLYPDLGPPAPRGLSLEALAEELADFAWGYLTAPRD